MASIKVEDVNLSAEQEKDYGCSQLLHNLSHVPIAPIQPLDCTPPQSPNGLEGCLC